MRTWLPFASLGTVLVSIFVCAGDASAQYRRYRGPQAVDLPPTEGKGCYFERGEVYCGSYCYWEVNGKRYCQSRLRHAHSQAPVEPFFGTSGEYQVLK